MHRLTLTAVLVALTALVGILVLADALHGAVALTYDETGNGCRELTSASADELVSAMLPVRALVVAWVALTGTWLSWRAVASVHAPPSGARSLGVVGTGGLALALVLFIGSNTLVGIVYLVAVWGLAACAVVALTVRAILARGTPVSRWLWATVTWLLITAGALPPALLMLTNNGDVVTC